MTPDGGDMPEALREFLTRIGSVFLEDMPEGCGFALFFFTKPTEKEPGRVSYVGSEPRPVTLSMLRSFMRRNAPELRVDPIQERGTTND